MSKLPYVPAKDCRHRVAAIALYRALITTARQVPHNGVPNRGELHPVVHLVQQRFRDNKNHRSLRLVYSSMTAGYKMLDMLHKAKIKDSPEWEKVVGLLKKAEKKERECDAKRKPETPAANTQAEEQAEPKIDHDWRTRSNANFTIRNIAGPFEPSRYEGSARPLPSLKQRRRVPNLVASTDGFPFLRYSGLQPIGLSHMIRLHKRQWQGAMYGMLEIEETTAPDVQWEDVWEENLEKVFCEEQGLGKMDLDDMDPDPQSTYVWAVQVGRVWYELKLDKLWQDAVARGEALEAIIQEEKRLQAVEDEQGIWISLKETSSTEEGVKVSRAKKKESLLDALPPKTERLISLEAAFSAEVQTEDKSARIRPPPPPAPPSEPISHPRTTRQDTIQVMNSDNAQVALGHWKQSLRTYLQKNNNTPPARDPKDSFVNPLWGMTVDSLDSRLRKLMAAVPNCGANKRFNHPSVRRRMQDDGG